MLPAQCSWLPLRRERAADIQPPALSGAGRPHATHALNVVVVDPTSIRRRMDVYAGGRHVGRVKNVDTDGFLLDRPWRRDVWVPLESVTAVADDAVLVHPPSSTGRIRTTASSEGRTQP
jgi:hypothetical protein